MAFDAREKVAQAGEKYPPFEWTDLNGETRHLRSAALIPSSLMSVITGLDGTDGMDEEEAVAAYDEVLATLQEIALDDESAAALLDLPTFTIGELIGAWLDEAGGAGKSPRQSSPRNRAERRSQSTDKAAESTSSASAKKPAKKAARKPKAKA